MASHLSNLALDELAAGLAPPADAAGHLDDCAACRARLEEIRSAHQQARSAPRFETTFARLQASQARPRRLRWALLGALPIAAAAAIALVVLPVPESGVRLKGRASLSVVRASSGAPTRTAHPGERVVLSVGAAGHPYGLVLAVDEQGVVTPLWPPDSKQSAPVPPGAEVPLEPGFEVTPGSIALFALFSEQPLDPATQAAALTRAVEQARGRGEGPLEVDWSPPGPVAATARTTLRVEEAE